MADKTQMLDENARALGSREHMIWQMYMALMQRPNTIYTESLVVAQQATDYYLNRIKFMEAEDGDTD